MGWGRRRGRADRVAVPQGRTRLRPGCVGRYWKPCRPGCRNRPCGRRPARGTDMDRTAGVYRRRRTTAPAAGGGTEQSGPTWRWASTMCACACWPRHRRAAGRRHRRTGAGRCAEGAIEPPTEHVRRGTIGCRCRPSRASSRAARQPVPRRLQPRLPARRPRTLCGEPAARGGPSARCPGRRVAPPRAGAGRDYRAAQEPFQQARRARPVQAEICSHAGVADTSLTLALDPSLAGLDVAATRPPRADDGVAGDPRRSSAELGRLGVDRIVDASVAAIRERKRKPR